MIFAAAEEVAHSSRYQCLSAPPLLFTTWPCKIVLLCECVTSRGNNRTPQLNTPAKGNSKLLLPFVLERKELYEKISP